MQISFMKYQAIHIITNDTLYLHDLTLECNKSGTIQPQTQFMGHKKPFHDDGMEILST